MNYIKDNNIIKAAYYKERIKTPRENKNNKEYDYFKNGKSKKKLSLNNKDMILFTNQNNINAINIINNNYNNIYLDGNKIRQKNKIILNESNSGIMPSTINNEKSLKKTKALKLIFDKSNNEKLNENKYQFIIDRLKNEIEYYKNKNQNSSNKIITNSPKSFRKKGLNKNLFLMTNKYNTIKTYENKIYMETSRKNKSNHYYETYNNNNTIDKKLTSDFSYKNNLNIYSNYVPKSYSNNILNVNSNNSLKSNNKRSKINYMQNISSSGINKSNNYITNDIINEDDNNVKQKSSFANSYNHKLYLNDGLSCPLSLKKNFKNIDNNIIKNIEKDNEIYLKKFNYRDKFENLKTRMNTLIGNLFDIIDLQKNQINKINKKE